MAPAGVGSTEPFSLCRYYERYGGFAKHRELALVAWQVAISFDLIMAGNTNGAADVIGLLAVYLDQLVLDQGATTVAWLLTLQQDPPQVLYSEPASAPSLGGATVFPPRRPKVDNLGSWLPSRDGSDRQPARRDKGKAQAAPRPAACSPPCASDTGRDRPFEEAA